MKLNQELLNQILEIRTKHEFLTFLILKDDDAGWRCGVIQNSNTRFINFFDVAKIRDEKSRKRFLSYADRWWWQSGMSLPIDAYIGVPFDEFLPTLVSLPRKTLMIDPIGPSYNLSEQYLRRVKKRRIDLVNRRQLRDAGTKQ